MNNYQILYFEFVDGVQDYIGSCQLLIWNKIISFIDVQFTFWESFIYISIVISSMIHLIICQIDYFSRIYEKISTMFNIHTFNKLPKFSSSDHFRASFWRNFLMWIWKKWNFYFVIQKISWIRYLSNCNCLEHYKRLKEGIAFTPFWNKIR